MLMENSSHVRVFVVEDEAIVALEIKDHLREMGYHVCGYASKGDGTARRILATTPDVVLLDINLGRGPSGLDVAEELRAVGDIPVVFLTAFADKEIIDRASKTGSFAYLTKPFHPYTLKANIELAVARNLAAKALRASEERFKTLIQQAPIPVLMVDRDGVIRHANPAANTLWKVSDTSLEEVALASILIPGESLTSEAQGDTAILEGLGRGADGSNFHVEICRRRLSDGRTLVFVSDITRRKQAENEVGRLLAAIEQATDAIVVADRVGRVVYVNTAFENCSGYRREEVLVDGAPEWLKSIEMAGSDRPTLLSAMRSGESWSGEWTSRHRDGTPLRQAVCMSPVKNEKGEVIEFVQVMRDVTRIQALQDAVQALKDLSRRIVTTLEAVPIGATPEELSAAVCAEIGKLPYADCVWVARFGDTVASVLAVEARSRSALFPGRHLNAEQTEYLRRRSAGGPWVERHETHQGLFENLWGNDYKAYAFAPLSGPEGIVGVLALGTRQAALAAQLVDVLPALASTGSALSGHVAVELKARTHRAAARAAIRRRIHERNFATHFQPIRDLATNRVVGFEALTRFSDGARPDAVFAQATLSDMDIDLETATLQQAFASAEHLPADAYLSINVSPAMLLSRNVLSLMSHYRRPLVVELTEHVPVEDYSLLEQEVTLLAPFATLAVDDAGAGHSSLRHILRLRPSIVKLDIGLIRDISTDPVQQSLVAGMVHFAGGSQIRLVAEGIERREDFETLRSLRVPYGQGYFLGRPSPAEQWTTDPALAAAATGSAP